MTNSRLKEKEGKLLYHLTPIKNIISILQFGLKPRSELTNDLFKDTANPEILQRRASMNLDQYVPLHFFMGTPYDYGVFNSYPKEDFAYISFKRSLLKNNCKIIVGHPLNQRHVSPYNWEDGFEQIDWHLISQRDYNNHDCKQMCMSEALYQGVIHPDLIQSIKVPQKYIKRIEEIKLKMGFSFFIDHAPKLDKK